MLKFGNTVWRRRSRRGTKTKVKMWFLQREPYILPENFNRSVFSSFLHCFKGRKVKFRPQKVLFGNVHSSKSNFKWNFGPAIQLLQSYYQQSCKICCNSGWTWHFFQFGKRALEIPKECWEGLTSRNIQGGPNIKRDVKEIHKSLFWRKNLFSVLFQFKRRGKSGARSVRVR